MTNGSICEAKLRDRHDRHARLERRISPRMLDRVAGFVCRDATAAMEGELYASLERQSRLLVGS